MAEALTSTLLAGGLLAACQEAAESPGIGVAAFRTWCVAQVSGWAEARRLVSRSNWFLHLRVLRAVGVLVPVGDAPGEAVPGWFGKTSMAEVGELLTQEPARLREVVGQGFRVVSSDLAFYALCGPHGNPMTAWPVDACGTVREAVFERDEWLLRLEHEDSGLPEHQRRPLVEVAGFLWHTVPMERRNAG